MAEAARVRVEVKPALLRWARDRAGMQLDDLARRFPQLARPTRGQLERFAQGTHATVDHLLLAKPPVERVPIPDFRAAGNGRIGRPSPNLLDTLSLCRQRQAWYRDFARVQGDKPLAFVGSASLKSDIAATAAALRSALGLDLEERQKISAWDKTVRRLIDHADALGILVMVSGVVGNNSYRRLDPREFRGFTLADARAPLVFINGADSKAAQMFTLAHALAHIWLGQSALSDATPIAAPEHEVERWCSAVATEVLVPLGALRAEYRRGEELRITLTRLAQRFKVSTPIILRRIHDLGVVAPVRLPSGRLRLVTSPRSIGSPAVKKTIGIVLVAAFAAKTEGVVDATITATWRLTRSAVNVGNLSLRPSVQRYSIATPMRLLHGQREAVESDSCGFHCRSTTSSA
jgi:Zn-dependent peptidase ImmA (M78 family)